MLLLTQLFNFKIIKPIANVSYTKYNYSAGNHLIDIFPNAYNKFANVRHYFFAKGCIR